MNKEELDVKIKVLFVSSGNLKNFDVAPFIKVQGESLRDINVDVEYFRISGKGFLGYLFNIKALKNIIKNSSFDIIHAHFTLSAWVAVLTFPKIPIVLSLMGTDAYGRVETLKKNKLYLNYFTCLTILIQPFISKIISKSPNIEKFVWIKKKSFLLPNGVDLDKFYPSQGHFKKELGLSMDKKYVLFLGNIDDPRKNFNLLEEIRMKLKKFNIELIAPYPIPHEKVFQFLNSVDLLVMCSLEEGSPNVVKEGMACNCKGVFTDVGDVRFLIEKTVGYEISEFESEDLLNKILKLINSENCDGRKRILELGLNLPSVAYKLKNIYIKALNHP